jgi:hypothetical protein
VEILSQDVSVTASSGDLNHLTLGDTLSVQLKKATNLGGQGDVVQVTLSGSGLVMSEPISFEISGFSTLQPEKAFENIARIEKISSEEVDSVRQVTLSFAGKGINKTVKSFEIRLPLEALLRKLAVEPQSLHTERLVDTLFGHLKNEWDKNSGSMWGTVYNNKSGELVLERLVKFYTHLTESSHKGNIKRHMTKLIQAFNGGTRPGFFSGSRDDFDEVMKLLSEGGLQ